MSLCLRRDRLGDARPGRATADHGTGWGFGLRVFFFPPSNENEVSDPVG